MTLLTTTIGSYPKPEYVQVPDWFHQPTGVAKLYDQAVRDRADELEPLFVRGTHEVVREQVALGIDVPTDGEIRRENYINYHCRHLDGFDFANLTHRVMRDGGWADDVPTIVGPIRPRERFLPHDYAVAQSVTDRPVKITIPGPLTIASSTADAYYGDDARLGADLADAINDEARALADAGCTWIQIDEPIFAREPDKALAFGFENLERCFHGLPDRVIRTVHICCGYPDVLDNEDYLKADRQAYFTLADAIEDSSIQVVSLEDAHRHNDLKLLEKFEKTRVILGVLAIARSRVEPMEEIRARLVEALDHIDAERLIAGPDCGLGFLPRPILRQKLANMVAAAQSLG